MSLIIIDSIVTTLSEINVEIDAVAAAVDIDPTASAMHIPIAAHRVAEALANLELQGFCGDLLGLRIDGIVFLVARGKSQATESHEGGESHRIEYKSLFHFFDCFWGLCLMIIIVFDFYFQETEGLFSARMGTAT